MFARWLTSSPPTPVNHRVNDAVEGDVEVVARQHANVRSNERCELLDVFLHARAVVVPVEEDEVEAMVSTPGALCPLALAITSVAVCVDISSFCTAVRLYVNSHLH